MTTITREDYARAESFLPWNVEKRIFQMSVEPKWIGDSERFWYRNRTRDGVEFVLVDPEARTRELAFDHVRLAAALTRASGKPVTHDQLPFSEIELVDGSVRFDADERRWECNLGTYECRAIERQPERQEGTLRSPDGQREAFVRDHNLWLRDVETGEERQLTSDGEAYNDYATLPEGRTSAVSDRLSGKKIPPSAVWSPDSTKLLSHRLDQRAVREMWLLQGHPGSHGARAVPHSYRMPLPGDEQLAQAQLLMVDADSGMLTEVQAAPLDGVASSPPERGLVGWSAGGELAWFIRRERGFLASSLHVIDAATGETHQAVEERGRTLTVPHLSPTTDKPMAWLASDGSEAIWHSQRDGWGHLYLYDATTGEVKRQLTSGPWVVRELVHVDEGERSVVFTAGGREEGQNPYQRQLYRISLDGDEVVTLSAEDADHQVTASKSGRFFIDTYSRPDLPPVSVVRDRSGAVVVALETADISGLLGTGWQAPQRYTLKARDGVTDIHALVIRPTNYDPTRRYPVLDSIYPGPQRVQAPVGFPGSETSAIAGFWAAQSLAELGAVVVMIDGQGMPFRSKAFHDFAYANFEDGGGLPDHIAALRQLAASDPSLDLSRVGIYGHSGGGYASVKALLQHPDFFKVAVSSSGNHDQRGYMAEWGETYLGLPATNPAAWEAQSNIPLVANLRGMLLLAWGEMDDNVHPALTIQLIDAFIKAGKDVDMLIIPNANHGFIDLVHAPKDTRGNSANNHFFLRKRWDYFVTHLLGAEPPTGYVIGTDQ
jgi:dipeptidyl aminopeptidase/acylaminoacyl peptidase